jgi:hypothetical protein
LINEHGGYAGPDWVPLNNDGIWTMIGLAYYMFEGITAVLPIMESSDVKEDFSYLLAGALAFLCLINICFSELSYYTYGSTLNDPVII